MGSEMCIRDRDFLIQLIRNLRQYSNVAGDKFRILGVSNGAALALRAFLELNDAGVTTVVSVVSALHINQWDNSVWYRPPTNESTGSANERYGYTLPITPPTGRNIMTIANTNDGVIPYNGGLGGVAGTTFFDSQFGAYLLATSQGYTGDQLGDPQGVQYSSYSNIYLYKYLNNSVVHVKSNTGHDIDAGHEALIRQYIESDGNSAG